jgi:micrococcal nuclease
MRVLKITSLVILCFLLSATLAITGQFKVTRVTDGDTVKVEGREGTMTIRLVGIDAPETSRKKREPGQPFSQQAKKYLASLVLNKNVDILNHGQDRYGRVLGVISLDGKNINLEMVKVGLAEVYRGKPAKGLDLGPYRQAERQARQTRLGMWSLGNKYVSPRDWRKSHKGG